MTQDAVNSKIQTMKAQAIVFDAPRQLSVKQLDLREPGADDLVVDVAYSGISTGTER
ncbi:MAG: chlorophyll synthesis pathway protein BchC, partial [Betaproteobacteria bacterium]|nr:chlorophyll synthesis pathway protein BchC [Betaproteobacteria bacterium]